MSKQLESILSRAPRATVADEQAAPAPMRIVAPAERAAAQVSETPAAAVEKSRDVSLGIEVPESVKRAVAIQAATEGITNRTLLLRALQGAGIAVPEDELRDRRK